ncbi:MAG: DUF4097 family beta strand repeat-containing protein [Phycisphaerales bacterium]|nr:DUF4097 family beta strand repeat-containing protein [Phycisphaerales bacterium]
MSDITHLKSENLNQSMKPVRLFPSFVVAAAMAIFFTFAARAEESTSSIKFSEPGKPGTVKIQMARGALHIVGSDVAEVIVKSEATPAARTPRKDGLRLLTSSSSFSLTEKENVVTLDAMGENWAGPGATFKLTVPRNTSVIVQNSWGGDISCSGLSGDFEINAMQGSIRLEDVSGGVVVSTMNGEIRANVREVHDGKPLSFQSMNGEVILRLPSHARANLRVRTQNGSVLTDFDESVLVTKTETAPGARSKSQVVINGHSILTPEARDAIREATRLGAEAVREAASAMREAAEAAREGAAEARAAAGTTVPTAPATPAVPRPPRPPRMTSIPTITGGKIVTGTLNGGGPEISVATMNGDVTLRQIERK